MSPIRIVVDGAPAAKGRPRLGIVKGHAMAFTPDKTRSYEAIVRHAASQEMGGRTPLDEALVVDVRAYLPVPRSWSGKKQRAALGGEIRPTGRPDCDNFIKAALDACNTVVFRDDSLIVELRASKSYSDRPRLEIEVRAA
jgi:Holliday junction resolvase RusA-like endonuclease